MTLYGSILILDGMLFFFQSEVISSPKYGKTYMIGSLIAKSVEVVAHIYLLVMGFKMQQVFREYGHIKGYKGEIFLIVVYLLFYGA